MATTCSKCDCIASYRTSCLRAKTYLTLLHCCRPLFTVSPRRLTAESIEWFTENQASYYLAPPRPLYPSPVGKLDRRHTGRLRMRNNLLTGEGVGEEPKCTMARKPDPLYIIQYSLGEKIEKDFFFFLKVGGRMPLFFVYFSYFL